MNTRKLLALGTAAFALAACTAPDDASSSEGAAMTGSECVVELNGKNPCEGNAFCKVSTVSGHTISLGVTGSETVELPVSKLSSVGRGTCEPAASAFGGGEVSNLELVWPGVAGEYRANVKRGDTTFIVAVDLAGKTVKVAFEDFSDSNSKSDGIVARVYSKAPPVFPKSVIAQAGRLRIAGNLAKPLSQQSLAKKYEPQDRQLTDAECFSCAKDANFGATTRFLGNKNAAVVAHYGVGYELDVLVKPGDELNVAKALIDAKLPGFKDVALVTANGPKSLVRP